MKYRIKHICYDKNESWYLTNQSTKVRTWWLKSESEYINFNNKKKAIRKLKEVLFKHWQYPDIKCKNEEYLIIKLDDNGNKIYEKKLYLEKEIAIFEDYYKKMLKFELSRNEQEKIMKEMLEVA